MLIIPKNKTKKCLVEVSYIYKNFFRTQRVFVLSLQTLKLVQTKNNMSLYSVRFSSAGVYLSVVEDKAQITLTEKLPRKS